MSSYAIPFWKKSPFIRLLIALSSGILLEWNYSIPPWTLWPVFIISLFFIVTFFTLTFFNRYRLGFITGLAVFFLFCATGGLLTWYHNIRNQSNWVGTLYQKDAGFIVTIDEPPVEKSKTVKAIASVNFLVIQKKLFAACGKIIVYFKKDSAANPVSYGAQLVFRKPLQVIKNTGNPGGFDYERYALFQGICNQVYLSGDEFVTLNKRKSQWLDRLLIATRENVIDILRRYIKGGRESGLAEALLIGYKDDLDASLVQSYTNTGVVHIIAISGMHIALIYWLLALLCKPLAKTRYTKWLKLVLVIAGLWLFSLVAGAQASVLRSALMFSCIAIGDALSRKTSIYNTLALSAFLLLCYDPFWLWDVGFQLSYAAVLSIVIFVRPLYHLLYIRNKFLDAIWKLVTVSLAAQVLTLPLSLYHFHQFPVYFLLTNIVAVPLSSLIVLAEIALCAFSFIPFVALPFGKLLGVTIGCMNGYIERIEQLPFSLWENLSINITQALFLYIMIAGLTYWLLEKSKSGLTLFMRASLIFFACRSLSFFNCEREKKIIVYNIPRQSAMDIIEDRHYFFKGDSDLVDNIPLQHFYLQPTRIGCRASPGALHNQLLVYEDYISYGGRHILFASENISYTENAIRPVIDLLIVSKNSKTGLDRLHTALDIKKVVLDSSVPAWKATEWKKTCEKLQVAFYDVNESGAFVMNFN